MKSSLSQLAYGRRSQVLLRAILPAWGIAGLLDWWFHRRSNIEWPENGGLSESVIHSLMLAEGGIPIALLGLAEVNPLVLSLMAGAAVAHEFTAHHDLQVAMKSNRDVVATEQQVHSFLETLPFFLVAGSALCMGRANWRSPWSLRPKELRLSSRALGAGVGWVVLSGAVPYGEELLRCRKRAQKMTSEP